MEVKPLQISPTAVTMAPAPSMDVSFSASGGTFNTTTPEYQFSVADETIGTISPSGVFTANSVIGSTFVTVSDAASSVSATVTVSDAATLVLAPERNPIAQGETINLYPSGGEGGYELALVGSDLAFDEDPDPGSPHAGFVNSSLSRYTADNSIGTVTIAVTDSASPTNMAELVVTIRPAVPTNFVANGGTGNPKSIDLSWEFDKPGIDHFLIERYERSSADATAWTVSATARGHLDTGLTPNTPYSYRIYAVKVSERSQHVVAFSVSNPQNP